jgi:hypothetical protein
MALTVRTRRRGKGPAPERGPGLEHPPSRGDEAAPAALDPGNGAAQGVEGPGQRISPAADGGAGPGLDAPIPSAEASPVTAIASGGPQADPVTALDLVVRRIADGGPGRGAGMTRRIRTTRAGP